MLFQTEKNMKPVNVSEAQRKAICKAIKQIKNGQFLTNEEANKEVREWLNKPFKKS